MSLLEPSEEHLYHCLRFVPLTSAWFETPAILVDNSLLNDTSCKKLGQKSCIISIGLMDEL
jgi:hypothetical protein